MYIQLWYNLITVIAMGVHFELDNWQGVVLRSWRI